MTREQAFKILRLDTTATDTQIKRKYANCARRAKFETSYDMSSATEAFDTLMGYSWGSFEVDKRYTQKGLNIKKIESFFYLHTRALLYSILVFAIVGSTFALFFLTKVNSDFSITVIGAAVMKDQEAIYKYYEELLDVKEVSCTSYTIGEFSDNEVALGGYWKLYQDLAGGETSVFVLSADMAKLLSSEGAVSDLLPYLEQMGISESDQRIIWWYDEYGNSIAAAYYFDESDILINSFKGKIPKCFSVSFRADVDELTYAVMNDFIRNGK